MVTKARKKGFQHFGKKNAKSDSAGMVKKEGEKKNPPKFSRSTAFADHVK